MTMLLTSVTMVGWADVPDSDWGDFRRRRAVDISNCFYILNHLTKLLTFWDGNPLNTDTFPNKAPVSRSSDVFSVAGDLRRHDIQMYDITVMM